MIHNTLSKKLLISPKKLTYKTNSVLKRNYTSKANKKVAVLLSGCGFRDGAEITESVSVLVHITRNNSTYKCFAPNIEQSVVADHSTPFDPNNPQFVNEKRNVLVEAARIARGDITDLEKLDADQYDALVLPGGYGVPLSFGKNFPNSFEVHPLVERSLKAFHSKKKPIGLICVAPVLGAKLFNASVAVPEYACGLIESLGGKPVVKNVKDIHVDKENLIVSTTAYMEDVLPIDVFTGIGNLIDNVLELTK